jgi:3-oxoacyl-[acyl-carrier protein] reductase
MIEDPLLGELLAGRDPRPLTGRAALVTGASRRNGIGYATARRLASYGADVFVHHHVGHDESQPWGADPGGIGAVLAGIREIADRAGARVVDAAADLADPQAPADLVARAVAAFGHLDVLVANQAMSGGDGALAEIDAARLDRHWAVDARASLLLARAFAARHDGRAGGRVVLLTSGQDLGPMPGEVAYAAAKGALSSTCATLAHELAPAGITVNVVNPGPVDTGYVTPELHAATDDRFPAGRWGQPDDPARLIAWLATDEARWITGQVIHSEGGFRRG